MSPGPDRRAPQRARRRRDEVGSAEARGAMRAGVRFDTVGLGIDQDSQLLTALAAESGGLAIKR
jgi:hypothetical protein